MSKIGYYRVKQNVEQDSEVKLYINNLLASTKNIIIKDWCEGNKRIKFINKDGQYRFLSFNRYFEGKDKVKELGKVNKLMTSLLDSQSSESSIGNKNDRTLSLRSDDISEDELLILNDLWASPRIYLYIGDGITEEKKDWIEVTIKAKKPILNIKKGSYTDILIDLTLPKHYTVNMI